MKTILGILIGTALLVLMGTAGAYDQGTISTAQCFWQSIISIAVMGASVYALKKLDR